MAQRPGGQLSNINAGQTVTVEEGQGAVGYRPDSQSVAASKK